MNHDVMKDQPIIAYNNGAVSEINDTIALEVPITILVNGIEFGTMMCTPTHIEEMTIGILASEGVILTPSDIDSLSILKEKGYVYVQLKKEDVPIDSYATKRYIGSCCGKSRKFYFQNDVRTAKTVMTKHDIHAEQIINLMEEMQENAINFQQTGGLHNTALCTTAELIVNRSDIGRHNALDKVYGYCLKNKVPLKDKVIVFSGRISSEVLLKVSKMGVGIMLSKSAPTTLAIDLAKDLGITTVGFIRGGRFNVYTHPDRVSFD
ncbi:formate dehydrogenase accessory sulfurtransferase FdhD [Bacillus shivajii]|uniref:formate dehydrogenase accessory sulfurtransferase FdhD n=1 Tax=Bacillus shivajii TaxID=1983719 RepID=UPI001CF9E44C|nr:formate dehydrogenase accessory sulfurtransferase FdhD [Bacillus shivajii]UCZ53126.1 formate dehydrogenase accessory sulfurtransferase FdhD [Bacillus shivajii]